LHISVTYSGCHAVFAEMDHSQIYGGGDAKQAPPAMKMMNRDVQGHDLIGRVIACIAEGHRYVALVLGYRESSERNENLHLLYYFADEATEEADLKTREWELDSSVDLTGLISQRIVVKFPGQYARGDEGEHVITDGMIPFEGFVVRCPVDADDDKWRIVYTYESIFEDRNLADPKSEWSAVETTEWTFKGLPIVSWSSKPKTLKAVVDEKLHWDRRTK